MRKVNFAATRIARADGLVREAAGRGANVILLHQLCEPFHFCRDANTIAYGGSVIHCITQQQPC